MRLPRTPAPRACIVTPTPGRKEKGREFEPNQGPRVTGLSGTACGLLSLDQPLCQIDLRLHALVWWNKFMPAASHMPFNMQIARGGCDSSLRERVSGWFSWVGRGGGKKQAPDANACFCFPLLFLLFGSGWAVCAVARWVNTISTIAWRAIPIRARRGRLSRTLANRPPLAERSSYPRPPPRPSRLLPHHCDWRCRG